MAQKVEVYWDDAWHSQADFTEAEAKKLKPHPTHSLGYLLKQDERVCVIAQSSDNEAYSELLVIPSGMIRRVKKIG